MYIDKINTYIYIKHTYNLKMNEYTFVSLEIYIKCFSIYQYILSTLGRVFQQ